MKDSDTCGWRVVLICKAEVWSPLCLPPKAVVELEWGRRETPVLFGGCPCGSVPMVEEVFLAPAHQVPAGGGPHFSKGTMPLLPNGGHGPPSSRAPHFPASGVSVTQGLAQEGSVAFPASGDPQSPQIG